MSATNIAIGVVAGLVGAAAAGHVVDKLAEGKEHGIHMALGMLVPAGIAYAAGGREPGSIARGALYGVAAGGAASTWFVSSFTFGGPGTATGFFGERGNQNLIENDPIVMAGRNL